MKLSAKIAMAIAALEKITLRQRAPVLVSWALSNRCNFKCKYCALWQDKSEELNTKQVFFIIDELAGCGNRAIAFTGGEPLLREDFVDIINYCGRKGIYTKVTTNGSFIRQRINGLGKIGMVRISFDGPKQIHDSQRQQGSYDQIIEAVGLLKKKNIKVGFNCVLTKLNIACLPEILKEASRNSVKIFFQPLEYRNSINYVTKNMPSEDEYRRAFNMLAREKKNGNKYIANSLAVLQYLNGNPNYSEMKCWAGILAWRITTQGRIAPCDRFINAANSYDCLLGDLKNAFKGIAPFDCPKICLRNYTLELNSLLSLRPSSLFNLARNS